MLSRKFGFLFIVLALMISVFAGCASNNQAGSSGGTATQPSGNGNSASSSGSTGSSGSGKQVTLTYWTGSWNNTYAPPVIKKFEAKYPNIKVNVQYFPSAGMTDKFLLALKNKTAPDVMDMAVDWTTPFATAGGLVPLDNYIAKDNVNMKDFYAGALKTIHVNGKVYALPYRSETHGLFYNKDVFKKAGLDPNTPPKTWDDVLADAQKISKSGGIGIGLVGQPEGDLSYQLINFIRSFGGDILTPDNKKSALDSKEAVAAVQYYVDLYRKYKVTPDSTLQNDNQANRNLFANGQVGMFFSGDYDIDPVKQSNPNASFGTAQYPLTPNIDRRLTLGGWNIGVTTSSKHPDAAWDFVNFIASPEISAEYSNTFSSRISAANNPKYQDPLVKPFTEMLQYGEPFPAVPQMTQIRKILFDNVQQALMGKVTVADAMKAASDQVNQIMQQQ